MVDQAAALQSELDELYIVRRKLLTGEHVEQYQFGRGDASRRVQRTPPDINRVEARIRTLEAQLGINTSRRRGAIGVSY